MSPDSTELRDRAALESMVIAVPDFPEPGVVFRDISPLLADGVAYQRLIAHMCAVVTDTDVSHVAGVESRGFIFGASIASTLGLGFVPIRKAGKLPRQTIGREYELEYGTGARLEIHVDAFDGQRDAPPRVALIDDVLATGGTAAASIDLLRSAGADVPLALFLVELADLGGRRRLDDPTIHSCFSY